MITGVSDRFLLLFALPDHYLIMGRHHLVGVTVPTGTASWSGVYSKRFRTQPDVTRGKEALNQDKETHQFWGFACIV